MKFNCAQKGCKFEADDAPDDCPVCNHPFIDADLAPDYNALTKASLIDEAKDRGFQLEADDTPWSRWKKVELIDLLIEDDQAETPAAA